MELADDLSTAGTVGAFCLRILAMAAELFGSAALTVDDIARSGTRDRARRSTFSGPPLSAGT